MTTRSGIGTPVGDPERRAEAEQTYRSVMRNAPPADTNPFKTSVIDTVFGELWTRPGLTRKERRWITLACAGAAGQAHAIREHMRAALDTGEISVDEMNEFVLQVAIYQGYPKGSLLNAILAELLGRSSAGPVLTGQ